MIHHYEIKLRGVSHEEDGTPCQDAFAVNSCEDNFIIAAVADGLGSAEYSDIASQMAVDTTVRYCVEHITQQSNADEILRAIKKSFIEALSKIEEAVKSENRELAQYHTTLSLAVLLGDTLYYGHSGDSGIVALTLEGLFEKVTEQQRDEDNNVFPLFFEDKWVFGQFEKKICSVLLATDGVLLRLFPHLLQNEPVNFRVNELGLLIDNRCLHIDEQGADAVKIRIENYVKDIPREDVGSDDITIVVLVNTSIKPGTQPVNYYQEPDWAELARKRDEEYERVAYPGRSDKAKTGKDTTSANDSKHIANKVAGTSNNIPVGSQASAGGLGKTGTDTENSVTNETEAKPPHKKGVIWRVFGW